MASAEEEVTQAFSQYREMSDDLQITLNEDSVPLFGLASAFAHGVEESLRVLAQRIDELARRTPDE